MHMCPMQQIPHVESIMLKKITTITTELRLSNDVIVYVSNWQCMSIFFIVYTLKPQERYA